MRTLFKTVVLSIIMGALSFLLLLAGIKLLTYISGFVWDLLFLGILIL